MTASTSWSPESGSDMLPSLHAVSSRCFRCLGPLQRQSQRNVEQPTVGPLRRLQFKNFVAATEQNWEEPLPQHSTSRVSQPSSAWHHEAKISHVCPACGQRILRLPVLERHLKNCCPDLISQQVRFNLGFCSLLHILAMSINQAVHHRPCKLLAAIRMI